MGFTVSGSVTSGGIGIIGVDSNPQKPDGTWAIDQWTSSWNQSNGHFVVVDGRLQNGGAPNLKSKDHDQYNGVISLRDKLYGTEFSVTNDPTPPKEIQDMIIKEQARGATDTLHPFWNYAYPLGDSSIRPGEKRYPELYGQAEMTYVRTQIHETSISLSAIADMYHPGPGKQILDKNLDPEHPDDGPVLEDCVGSIYYKQMGLTPVMTP